jgi:heparan-alpha-glucosaminide N-acetyltransferase
LNVIDDSNPDCVREQRSAAQADQPGVQARVASVDALRGLTILLMIFVNDLGPGAPSWMHHIQPPHADGMTLADVVFPAFLFIVGISIPLAFERGRHWRNAGAQLGHVVIRTLALLFMGLVQLNGERDRTLRGSIWETLAFIGLICAWVVVPDERGGRRNFLLGVKVLGAGGLLVLLAIFRGEPHSTEVPFLGRFEGWVWFRTEWWGILGLIGWAYLTVAILWLILGRRREWLMGALACLILLHLAMERGGLFTRLNAKTWLGSSAPVFKMMATAIDYLNQFVGLGEATGSLAAIAMAGCLLGAILRRDSDVKTHRERLRWASTFVIGLLLAGFLTDTFEGINKIAATPTWCLWCAALTGSVWMILYWIMDIAGARGWDILVRPAGANPLVAYFLHPITVGLIYLAGLASPLLAYKQAHNPYMVVSGSLGMAIFVCVLTGLLARLGLRMRV